MEFLQLKYFQSVAYCNSFSIAANKLYISQPAISLAISRLEKELGVNLFIRKGKSIELSDFGKIFLNRVNVILNELENAKKELSDLQAIKQNNINLATTSPQFLHGINSFLANNDVKLRATVRKLPEIIDLMNYNLIDASITSPGYENCNVESITLFNDRFMVAVHKNNPLSKLNNVSLDQLIHEDFILLDKGFPFRQQTDELFESAGFSPNIIMECDHSLRSVLLEQNLGITISSNSAKLRKVYGDNIVFIPINGINNKRDIVLSWNKNLNITKGFKSFCYYLINYYNNLQVLSK
ncbi:LysR family transcriptional regulator [Peptoniphilus catoniae]|uniref:LysR family transcriptional regulator n=1 Tax=Peptoniphilus catoniae TaxID=1660341 RepID=UPI0015D623D0|nr:LysR family transcriptional regulator [Peptoniphilus catoniae]